MAQYVIAIDQGTTGTRAILVGDVCTVFLREDGSYQDIEINRRATGPTPAELARIPRRLCVVAGEAKLRPLLAAIRAGAVTDLIIDEPTARRLAPRPGLRATRA